MKLDLHVHSIHSGDGSEDISSIIKTAISRGLDGIAICDHGVFLAHDEACALAPEGFIIIPGVEYRTDVGHVLALFVTERYEMPRIDGGKRRVEDLKRAAEADGALLIAAHPYRKRDKLPPKLLPNVHGVETDNSRDGPMKEENASRARADAKSCGKFITGGSDGHILHEIGACYTILPDDTERTPDGVKAALLSGLSDAGGRGGRLRDQAVSKLRHTKPRTFLKDIARFIVFTAKDVKK